MTTTKSLPARPSLESLRKQAKKLAREVAAGHSDALARVRSQLPQVHMPLSRRDAQLVVAREYGYAGWEDLTAEVLKRLGGEVEWAVGRAKRLIHANDVEALRQLLVAYPALLSWGVDEGGLLGIASSSYGDSYDPERERQFTRRECAELLIEAGAVVTPSTCEGLLQGRVRGLLQLYQSKGLLPATLKFCVGLGDLERVQACFDGDGRLRPAAAGDQTLDKGELVTVNEAFMLACRFQYETIALFLLERYLAFDSALRDRIDQGPGRIALVKYLAVEQTLAFIDATPTDPWQVFLLHRVVRAIHDRALTTFTELLESNRWLLEDSWVGFQIGLIERATVRDAPDFIVKLVDLAPALLRRQPLPPSQAIEFAIVYVKPHIVPLLRRIWPLPDDLEFAAGTGDFAGVRRWFDGSHASPDIQQTLDTAFAWAVLNRHLEIAAFLLERGADINTRWGSHEPASVLHELVFREDYVGMQFLIDRGIDMTSVDYRWGGTAEGWARYAANKAQLADWLAARARERSMP